MPEKQIFRLVKIIFLTRLGRLDVRKSECEERFRHVSF